MSRIPSGSHPPNAGTRPGHPGSGRRTTAPPRCPALVQHAARRLQCARTQPLAARSSEHSRSQYLAARNSVRSQGRPASRLERCRRRFLESHCPACPNPGQWWRIYPHRHRPGWAVCARRSGPARQGLPRDCPLAPDRTTARRSRRPAPGPALALHSECAWKAATAARPPAAPGLAGAKGAGAAFPAGNRFDQAVGRPGRAACWWTWVEEAAPAAHHGERPGWGRTEEARFEPRETAASLPSQGLSERQPQGKELQPPTSWRLGPHAGKATRRPRHRLTWRLMRLPQLPWRLMRCRRQ